MEIEDVSSAFAALGQGTRLELLRILLAAGPNGLPAGEMADRLGVPSSTLSFHLKGLDQAGLIGAARNGRNLIYTARIDRLGDLLAFLIEPCCNNRPERCGELTHVLDVLSETQKMNAPTPFNVLFLCTHNSARSIMAETILNEIGQGKFVAYSAGSDPAPNGPLPEVLERLKSLGHDVSSLRSKSWDEFAGPQAPHLDFVITLCDTVTGQVCPDFGATLATAAWPMPDPAKFVGSAVERTTLLNELYAGLRRRLQIFASLPVASLDRMALKARIDELANPYATAR